MIDDVDAIGDSIETFNLQHTYSQIQVWNGRDISVPPSQTTKIQPKLFQFPSQDQPFPHSVEQIHLDEEDSEFTFAPCSFKEQLTVDIHAIPLKLSSAKASSIASGTNQKKESKKRLTLSKKP